VTAERAAGSGGWPTWTAPPGTPDPHWLTASLNRFSDCAFVIDAETRVIWANPAGERLLGYEPGVTLGRSIAEFVHEEDLLRAAEVIGLAEEGHFETSPITPALYRIRHADGHWVTLEINAATVSPDDASMLIIARQSGDLVLGDQLLEAVTEGRSFEEQAALVIELGRWRHPNEGYGLLYRDHDGTRRALVSNLSDALCGLEPLDGTAPWEVTLTSGSDLQVTDLGDTSVVSPALAQAARSNGFVACLTVPIADPMHAEGACIIIWATHSGPSVSGHRYAVANMERALTLVLQWRAHVTALERAARIDDLTGVANRSRFFQLLEAAPDPGPHAVLYLDLDGFKSVNDRLGHMAGDVVLAATAQRMRQVLTPGDVLGRLGGDEFAVLCAPGSAERAPVLAQRIVDALGDPVAVDGEPVLVGASIGVAVGDADERPEALLDAADRALLAAKADGRGRVHVSAVPRTRG